MTLQPRGDLGRSQQKLAEEQDRIRSMSNDLEVCSPLFRSHSHAPLYISLLILHTTQTGGRGGAKITLPLSAKVCRHEALGTTAAYQAAMRGPCCHSALPCSVPTWIRHMNGTGRGKVTVRPPSSRPCSTNPVRRKRSSARAAPAPRRWHCDAGPYDAFVVFGATLPEKVGVFHSSSLKMAPISPNASKCQSSASCSRSNGASL
jgi:hypothetical protein